MKHLFSSGSTATLSIRKKMALFFLASAVTPLLVAAVMLSLFSARLHRETAQNHFETAFRRFERQLANEIQNSERTTRSLVQRADFVAEVSLPYRYLDPTDYEPLVFESTLRRLAQILYEQSLATGVDRLILYDGHGRMLSVNCMLSGVPPLFVTYEDGRPEPVLLHSDGEAEVEPCDRDSLPPLYRPELADWTDTHFGRVTASRLYMDGSNLLAESWTPVVRQLPDGDTITVGHVFSGILVDPANARYPGLATGAASGLYRPGFGSDHIPPEAAAVIDAGDPSAFGPGNPLFFTGGDLFLSAIPLEVAGEDTVWMYIKIGRGLLQRETRSTFLVVLVTFIVSTIVVIPVAFYTGDRYFGLPAREISRGAEAIRSGDYAARIDLAGESEFGVLATAFNEMATTVENYTGTLEKKVQERTRELEEANAAKSRFLARVTHEIRNPMNGVMGMAQLLANSNLTTEHREYAGIILESSQHLLDILNDILDYSKIEAGKVELRSERFSPAAVARDVVQLFKPRMIEKGIEPRLDIDPAVPSHVVGDPGRLRQVLANLVGNASKFTDQGAIGVRVDVAARSIDTGDAVPDPLRSVTSGPDDDTYHREPVQLRFAVQDTGIGLDRDQINRLFSEYAQVHSESNRTAGGTGLGLSIVKELVRLMGGDVTVESTVGEGSTFSFSIIASVESSPHSS